MTYPTCGSTWGGRLARLLGARAGLRLLPGKLPCVQRLPAGMEGASLP